MTASAAAAAVSIVMHTLCIITRYNYAFMIARSRTRRKVDPGGQQLDFWRIGMVKRVFDRGYFWGDRGRFSAPPSGRGRASKSDWRDDFSFFYFFSLMRISYFSLSFLSLLFSLPRKGSNGLNAQENFHGVYLSPFTMIWFVPKRV